MMKRQPLTLRYTLITICLGLVIACAQAEEPWITNTPGSYTEIGITSYGPNGTYTMIGNTTYGPKTTCTVIGNTTYCN